MEDSVDNPIKAEVVFLVTVHKRFILAVIGCIFLQNFACPFEIKNILL